jgi:hypothetical protein
MSYFYVLTFMGDKRPEFWFAESCSVIVEYIQDFMFPEDEYDENMISISLECLEVNNSKELNEQLKLDKYLYEDPPNLQAIKKLALKIDKKNKSLKFEVPENPLFCKSCYTFTEKKICIACERETIDCDF